MRRRAQSAALIVPVVALAVAASPAGIAVLALVLAALAGRETERLLTAAGRRVTPRGVPCGAVALVAIAAASVLLEARAGAQPEAPPWWTLAAPPLVLVAAGAWALRERDPERAFATWEATAFGALYVGMLAFVVVLAGFGVPALPALWPPTPGLFQLFWTGTALPDAASTVLAGGRGWPLVLIATVWSFDTGAYLVGRTIGRRPFFAWISASKTLEGFVGGVVAATAVVVASLAIVGRPPLEGLILGPVLAAAAQAGDLAESALKRSARMKDSGALIPGHGGVLDRIDSFLFAAPVLAAYVVLANA